MIGEDVLLASEETLLCENRDISDFFPKTVFVLMEKLIYRVDGVKYVQWDRNEQRWHVDTVSNDISPLLQGHSVIHATEWIPKSWVSRRAVKLRTKKSRGTLGFLAKLRKIGQPNSDPRLVAVTAAHIFFRGTLAHNWSMVEFFEASCQIGETQHTWTLDRNLTGLQFPSTAFFLATN